MDKFDEKIIGYESTKNILRQILDTIQRLRQGKLSLCRLLECLR